MNILFINSIGRDKFGGGEKWMVNAAKGLAKRGHNVLLASKKRSKIIDYANNKGVKTTIFEIRGDVSPITTLKIAQFLKKNAIDVLICNLNKDVRVAGLAARMVKTPLVLARHGMLLCGNKWKHKVTLTQLVDGIITNSKTIKDAYQNYGWFEEDFVKVIYNGIHIPNNIEAYNFTKDFPNKKIIYSAGRLAEQKGFTYLIETAALLQKERNDLIFVISGEGKLENELKAQVTKAGLNESFIFLGFINDIFPYLKGCDLFVLASLFEGMPNVVMEAMAMKKPVIATDVNGARELMVNGETGIIVPPRAPQIMADAIKKIIDNEELLTKMGQNGYERVKSTFTMEAMANALEEHLLRQLTKTKNNN